jgi:hypothetical protein
MSTGLSKPAGLAGYKIGLLTIGIFSVVLLGIAGRQAYLSQQDKLTSQAVQQLAGKLDSYIGQQSKVPVSTAVAGMGSLPASVTYQKQSATTYRVCATYHSATPGIGPHSFTYRGPGYYSTNTDYLSLNIEHGKGKTCQIITAPVDTTRSGGVSIGTKPVVTPYTKNVDGSYTVCGVHVNYFDTEGHIITVTATSLTSSAISFPYTGAYQLAQFSAGSQVFDNQCNMLATADLQVGDTVDIFDITSPATISATSIFLKVD